MRHYPGSENKRLKLAACVRILSVLSPWSRDALSPSLANQRDPAERARRGTRLRAAASSRRRFHKDCHSSPPHGADQDRRSHRQRNGSGGFPAATCLPPVARRGLGCVPPARSSETPPNPGPPFTRF